MNSKRREYAERATCDSYKGTRTPGVNLLVLPEREREACLMTLAGQTFAISQTEERMNCAMNMGEARPAKFNVVQPIFERSTSKSKSKSKSKEIHGYPGQGSAGEMPCDAWLPSIIARELINGKLKPKPKCSHPFSFSSK